MLSILMRAPLIQIAKCLSRFEELAAKNQMTALHYLQTTLSEIIDHSDPEQTREVSFKCCVLI